MRLYVLDCGSLAALHYFGAPGEVDAMIMGCENWLCDFEEKLRPTHAVLALDSPSSWRKTADPTYKANRPPMPEDYGPQLRRIPELFARHGIKSIGKDGYEADDIIASVVARHGGGETEIVVVSEDKDLSALVGTQDNVQQYTPRGGVFYDAAGIRAKFGFDAWRIPEFLALAGDTSDGIKGIKGVGAKTATEAIQQTRGSFEIFDRASKGTLDLGKRAQKLIAEGRDQYNAAMRMVQLRFDAEVSHDLEAFRLRAIPLESVAAGEVFAAEKFQGIPAAAQSEVAQ